MHGLALQSNSNELVKCLEDLKDKRHEVENQINRKTEERTKIEADLQVPSSFVLAGEFLYFQSFTRTHKRKRKEKLNLMVAAAYKYTCIYRFRIPAHVSA